MTESAGLRERAAAAEASERTLRDSFDDACEQAQGQNLLEYQGARRRERARSREHVGRHGGAGAGPRRRLRRHERRRRRRRRLGRGERRARRRRAEHGGRRRPRMLRPVRTRVEITYLPLGSTTVLLSFVTSRSVGCVASGGYPPCRISITGSKSSLNTS